LPDPAYDRLVRFWLAPLWLLAAACAQTEVPRGVRTQLVQTARHELGLPAPGGIDWVATVLARARVHAGRSTDQPLPGDVVRFAGGASGVVVRARDDGRVEFLYVRMGQVREGVVSTRRPDRRRDGHGRLLNSYLRPRRRDDPPGTRYLAGELDPSFAAVEPD
jgi:hypothetical protein